MEETGRRLWVWLVPAILLGGFGVALNSTSETASAYTPHDPIVVIGNADFTPENGVSGGTGTPSDPFIIEGWEIEVFATTGISITETDAWFVIRDVHLFNSNETASTGVSLWGARNGSLEDSNLSGMGRGVDITASSDIAVIGCDIPSNQYGISISESWDVLLSRCVIGHATIGVGVYFCNDIWLDNNTVTDGGTGVDLYDCTGAEIFNNTIARNWGNGLVIASCAGVSVHNNTFISDGIALEGTDVSHYDSHQITANNLVNGKPLYYISNQEDISIDGIPVGQLIVSDSRRVSIWNLVIDDTDTSIQISYCSVVWVYFCELSKNPEHGIHAVESESVTVHGCTIAENRLGGGIHFVGCHNLSVDWNRILDSGRGLSLESSSEVYATNNMVQNQSGSIHFSFGVFVYESRNVTMDLNLIEGFDKGLFGYHAWFVSTPGHVRLYNTTISNCTEGVRFDNSAHIVLADNVIFGCDNGIVASSSSDMTIVRNVMTDNGNGLSVVGSTSHGIWVNRNSFINNAVQASDASGGNYWDLGYPDGGNYWSDYAGVDLMNGPSQDLLGADSIGDTPRAVTGTISDNYPLMLPYPTNRPPVAVLGVAPDTGDVETIFSFEASSSWDYESLQGVSDIEVRWDWESDGVWDTGWSTDLTATHQFVTPGTYNVTLQVRDFNGSVSSASVEVVVTEVIPEFGTAAVPGVLALIAVIVAIRRVRMGRDRL